MSITFNQTVLNDEITKFINNGFTEHARQQIGINDVAEHHTVFLALDNNEIVGAISILPFWGASWIKSLCIKENYRHQGMGESLILKAIDFAKEQNHRFLFLETLSFQACEFYQKLGFTLEFTRHNYSHGVSFHYLRKDL